MPASRGTIASTSTRVFHQQAALRPEARARQRAAALRVRGAAGRARRAPRLDPIELRRKNIGHATLTTVNGHAHHLERVPRVPGRGGGVRAGRAARSARARTRAGRGGLAYISGTNYPIYPNEMPQSAVQLKVDRSGVVTVFCGASEIGQGRHPAGSTWWPRSWGWPLGAVRVVSADTDLTPVDLGAYSSRGTFMNGNAASTPRGRCRSRSSSARWEEAGARAR
jgi:4-hydroxybenzoyl-CoA reductase subunit alpha